MDSCCGHAGEIQKTRRGLSSPKLSSVGEISQMSRLHFRVKWSVGVDIFHSGSKCWTDRLSSKRAVMSMWQKRSWCQSAADCSADGNHTDNSRLSAFDRRLGYRETLCDKIMSKEDRFTVTVIHSPITYATVSKFISDPFFPPRNILPFQFSKINSLSDSNDSCIFQSHTNIRLEGSLCFSRLTWGLLLSLIAHPVILLPYPPLLRQLTQPFTHLQWWWAGHWKF